MTEYYIEYGTTFYTTQTQTELSRVVSGHIHAVTKLRKWEDPMINTKFKIIFKKNLWVENEGMGGKGLPEEMQ